MAWLRMIEKPAAIHPLDIGALDWYTRCDRACNKPLILLLSLALRGNPTLSAAGLFFSVSDFQTDG